MEGSEDGADFWIPGPRRPRVPLGTTIVAHQEASSSSRGRGALHALALAAPPPVSAGVSLLQVKRHTTALRRASAWLSRMLALRRLGLACVKTLPRLPERFWALAPSTSRPGGTPPTGPIGQSESWGPPSVRIALPGRCARGRRSSFLPSRASSLRPGSLWVGFGEKTNWASSREN